MNTLEAKKYIIKLIDSRYKYQYEFAENIGEDAANLSVRINSLDPKDNKHKVRYLRKLGVNAEEIRDIVVR